MSRSFSFTSESVSEGHPDKVADQISDAVLDAILKEDDRGSICQEDETPPPPPSGNSFEAARARFCHNATRRDAQLKRRLDNGTAIFRKPPAPTGGFRRFRVSS